MLKATFPIRLANYAEAEVVYENRRPNSGLNINEMRALFQSLGLRFAWDWWSSTAGQCVYIIITGRISALRRIFTIISPTDIATTEERCRKIGFAVQILDSIGGDPRIAIGGDSPLWQRVAQLVCNGGGGEIMALKKTDTYVTINSDGPEADVKKEVEKIAKALEGLGFAQKGEGEEKENKDLGTIRIRKQFTKS